MMLGAGALGVWHGVAEGREQDVDAWYDREHAALGFPYPPVSQRFEMLEETLQICRQMWSEDNGPYQGRHYQLAETICEPQPIRRPPILIGGDGEKKTLRLVAQYADACNVFGGPERVAHKFEVLRGHCDAVGRDYDSIEKTLLTQVSITTDGARRSLTPDALVERLARTTDVGAQHAIFSVRDVHDLSRLELIGSRVIPQLRNVGQPSPVP